MSEQKIQGIVVSRLKNPVTVSLNGMSLIIPQKAHWIINSFVRILACGTRATVVTELSCDAHGPRGVTDPPCNVHEGAPVTDRAMQRDERPPRKFHAIC